MLMASGYNCIKTADVKVLFLKQLGISLSYLPSHTASHTNFPQIHIRPIHFSESGVWIRWT